MHIVSDALHNNADLETLVQCNGIRHKLDRFQLKLSRLSGNQNLKFETDAAFPYS